MSGSARCDQLVVLRYRQRASAKKAIRDEDDEAWYVLSGTLGFLLGDQEVEARAGSAVLARRGTAHTFWNAGPVEARYLLVMTPRIAQLIEEIHHPGADVAAIFAAHKSRIVQSP